ncbi:MAG: RICIN domain-containing protein [Anaerolineales bacterium]
MCHRQSKSTLSRGALLARYLSTGLLTLAGLLLLSLPALAQSGSKYLDASYCADTLRANTRSDFDNGSCQLWKLVPDADGWSRLQIKRNGKFLSVDNCSDTVKLNGKSNFDNGSCQLWKLVPDADGWSRLQIKRNGKFLSVDDCVDEIKVNSASAYNDHGHQLWRLVPAADGWSRLQIKYAGAAAANSPTILIHTGSHYIWYTKKCIWDAHQGDISALFDYMDRAFSQIVLDWRIKLPREQYYLWVDPKTGLHGCGGNCCEDIHKVTGKAVPCILVGYENYITVGPNNIKGHFAYTYGTHETVNLLTGELAGGWPWDWWADDKSPFPAMTAVRVEAELGRNDISAAHGAEFIVPRQSANNAKLYAMFKAIQVRYGWPIFQKMFVLMKADGVRLSNIDSGHNPSLILTAYVTAYMVLGSGDTLRNMGAHFFANTIPGYEQKLTRSVLDARKNWKEHGGNAKTFRSGLCLVAHGYTDSHLPCDK